FNLAHHVGDDPTAVDANRARLADSLGLTPGALVWMEQLHTNTVTMVDSAQSDPVEATDALVTTTPGLALAVLVADCVPLLLADQANGVVAAVHAGRMGARNGIVPATGAKMVELGAQPSGIQAVMGAAAAGRNYEVPQE
ncbi:laccase domain-containing protein, partial [Acinetobacter baumannii]|nr:laccase domain-containing protein [Acinetobacter baumannii]